MKYLIAQIDCYVRKYPLQMVSLIFTVHDLMGKQMCVVCTKQVLSFTGEYAEVMWLLASLGPGLKKYNSFIMFAILMRSHISEAVAGGAQP